jgi:hypothetical protein
MDPWKLSAGLLVAGRFEIESLVRSGGMGKLFRAHDREAGGQVALKMLRLSTASDWTPSRFAQEMVRLSALRHPGIAPLVAHGQTEQGELYVATAWLEGEDLARRLGQKPLRVGETLSLARHLAEALALVHARGLVHGDIKPRRLFLRAGAGADLGIPGVEAVMLLGLGLPRSHLSARTVTNSGEILANLLYVAPELVRGEGPLGPQADIYSLGCVLFECLVGAPPFAGEHAGIVLVQRLSSEVPLLRQLRPELPESLERLLAAMMAPSAAARFGHGGELVAALATLELQPQHLELVPTAVMSPALAGIPVGAPGGDQDRRLVSLILAIPPLTEEKVEPAADAAAREPHGSHVDASEFDRLMAAFGAQVDSLADGSILATLVAADVARQTATDQVVQAARAAWQLQQLLPEWQVAVATGHGIVSGKQAMGEALRQAATLLDDGEARPGTVWLDELTADLLDTRFHVRQLGPERWALGGERRGGEETRLLLGRPTPCVGREQELRLLSGVVTSCMEEPRVQAVLVLGPSGMGKSRLRQELVRRLAAQGIELKVAVGRGDLMSAGTAYGLLGQAVLELCGITRAGEEETRRAQLVERVRQRVGSQEDTAHRVAEFLGELCGLPFPDDDSPQLRAARQDPRLMRDQVAAALLAFLRGECAAQLGQPVLIVLEDLHWSDEASVRLVEAILRQLGEQPLIVLALARPEAKERFPRLWESCPVQELRLGGLGRKASEQLVRTVLGERATAETVERIVTQAEGHALFLEELIRAVAEGAEELPETVLAMLQARLLRLDARARRVLAAASVFGERFWRGGLLALLGPGSEPWADGHAEMERGLPLLMAAETIARQRESRFEGEAQYVFRHALVREAAYGLLSEEERRAGHLAAGQYLEGVGEREPMVLAEHYLRGGEMERASRFFARAAMELMERSDLGGALRCVERGLGCGATGEVEGTLRAVAAQAHMWSFDWVLSTFEMAHQALPLLTPGCTAWYRAIGTVITLAAPVGRPDFELPNTRLLLQTTPLPGAEGVLLEQSFINTAMLASQGHFEVARALRERMHEICAPLGDNEARARGLMHVADALYALLIEGAPERYLRECEAARGCFVKAGDRRYQVIAEAHAGFALGLVGDWAGGATRLRAALAACQELGEATMECVIQGHLALVLIETGAPEHQREAEALAEAVVSSPVITFWIGLGYCALAGLRAAHGEFAVAEGLVRRVLSPVALGPLAASLLGRILVAQGKVEEARAVVEQELERLSGRGGRGFMDIKLYLAAAELRHAGGEDAGAREALSRASALIDEHAAAMADEAMRVRYRSDVPDNARVLELRRRW